jgi:cysteine-rich repeat protein
LRNREHVDPRRNIMKSLRLGAVVLPALFAAAVSCTSQPVERLDALINDGPECVGARTPGFWCQNQDGHPELSAEEFQTLAAGAAVRLAAVAELDTAEEIAAAVCDTSNQLVRHLAATALDLEANLISVNTPLVGEDFATVGEAVDAAIAILTGNSDLDAEAVKDVLDAINNNTNTILGDECGGETQPVCGDNHVDEGEQCDDGNTTNGDGCDENCMTEGGGGEQPFCGDGTVDENEECDDGNNTNGDGCNSNCEKEGVCDDEEC